MADDKYTFEQARIRLEEIATEVRKKDTSLEKSLDLLEEGVRLANICTELVDHTDVGATVTAPRPQGQAAEADAGVGAAVVEEVETAEEAGDDTGGLAAAAEVAADETDGFDDADDDVDEPTDAGSDE